MTALERRVYKLTLETHSKETVIGGSFFSAILLNHFQSRKMKLVVFYFS